MSEKINDGGPAFSFEGGESNRMQPEFGMTLRDYFAAKAIQGLMGRSWDHLKAEDHVLVKTWASASYKVADAMLAAREVQS